MARPGRPERNRTARSFGQLRRFHHVINSNKVFDTDRRQRLSICRSIIEAHNGRLWASPNVPRGAIFCFTAPAHPAAASNIVGDGVECAEADNSTHVPPSGYSFVGTVVPLAGDAESSGELRLPVHRRVKQTG